MDFLKLGNLFILIGYLGRLFGGGSFKVVLVKEGEVGSLFWRGLVR